MAKIDRILVVSRSTKSCQKTVHYGISLARQYNAELFILHVEHNPFGTKGWSLPIFSLEEDYKKLLQEAKKDLDRIIAQEKTAGLPIREMIVTGEPTKEIVKVVEEENIDLLVLLSHEEWHLEHFLFGRTNRELVRKMPCSIFLVKKDPEPVAF
ncbi:universal stress protein [Syntrophotalea acetylenivorans]|uniref:Universal stress protein n=1 Tax=Syntrophotalea acetylenivorans TaxID=1842532 RepID=A0A1L3GQC0_9BACT|nr:universal stress protein [Syntrophotalea acetylenivorans]APG28127.1 universal stress protein [Syntrophotalea acetylenivorans]